MRFALFIAVIFFFAGPALAKEKPCDPIATVYDEAICEKDIAISEKEQENIRAYAEKNDQNPDKAVEGVKLANLFNMIWEKALIEKFGHEAITPSDQEIKTYVQGLNNMEKKRHSYDLEMSKLIKKLLSENEYSE